MIKIKGRSKEYAPPVKGYAQEWYIGTQVPGERIAISLKNVELVEALASAEGIELAGNVYGRGLEEKFYDSRSYLLKGTILSIGERREFFGRNNKIQKIRVSRRAPEKIIRIMAEEEDRVIQAAEFLRLPLEKLAETA